MTFFKNAKGLNQIDLIKQIQDQKTLAQKNKQQVKTKELTKSELKIQNLNESVTNLNKDLAANVAYLKYLRKKAAADDISESNPVRRSTQYSNSPIRNNLNSRNTNTVVTASNHSSPDSITRQKTVIDKKTKNHERMHAPIPAR